MPVYMYIYRHAVSTEEDLEAASTLLSLGDTLDDTLDDDDENAQLMPIGGDNVPEHIVPEQLRLDQVVQILKLLSVVGRNK